MAPGMNRPLEKSRRTLLGTIGEASAAEAAGSQRRTTAHASATAKAASVRLPRGRRRGDRDAAWSESARTSPRSARGPICPETAETVHVLPGNRRRCPAPAAEPPPRRTDPGVRRPPREAAAHHRGPISLVGAPPESPSAPRRSRSRGAPVPCKPEGSHLAELCRLARATRARSWPKPFRIDGNSGWWIRYANEFGKRRRRCFGEYEAAERQLSSRRRGSSR